MKSILPLVVLLGLAQPCYAATMVSSDGFDGKTYDYTAEGDDAGAKPAWKPTDQNPPLSARRAIAAGENEIERLFGKKHRWEFDHLLLEQCVLGDDDGWIWVAEFGPAPPFGGRPSTFRVIVHMDGSVPKPKVHAPRKSK